jgi:arginyl-tRNA synthetase
MIIQKLENFVTDITNNLGYKVDNMRVIISNRPDLCDYQCDDVFKLAKEFKQNPIDIGTKIVDSIINSDEFNNLFEKVEFIKPGFINMTLSSTFINECLYKMINTEYFALPRPNRVETFVLDYGGPNVAKPLHVGHMRTAIVGESLKRIIKYMGHNTIADVHLGDYGLQIGQVIYGVKRDNKSIEEIDIEYLDEIYPEMSSLCKENEDIKEECAEITRLLQDGNEEYKTLWKKICEVSSQDILKIYKYLDVSFDLWLGESDAYPFIPKVEEIFNKKGLIKISDGAAIIEVGKDTDKKEIPPLLFQKSNGAYLYATTDLATVLDRMKNLQPDHILYITDNRQDLHFEQVFRASDLSSIAPYSMFEHLGYGTVNGADGKPYKTRSGDSPKLENLFIQAKEILIEKKETNSEMNEEDVDKIVNAILKFADLQNNRERDYIFDISKFSETVGKTGPYILYTYLRTQKIIVETEKNINNFTSNIYNNYDRDLRLKLLELPIAFKNAYDYRMPHYIADYIYDVCVLANAFYQNNHINGLDDNTKKNDWMLVLSLTCDIIKEMLSLLVIDIPTEM